MNTAKEKMIGVKMDEESKKRYEQCCSRYKMKPASMARVLIFAFMDAWMRTASEDVTVKFPIEIACVSRDHANHTPTKAVGTPADQGQANSKRAGFGAKKQGGTGIAANSQK